MFEKRPAKLIYLTGNCYALDQEASGVVEEQSDQIPRQPVVRRFDLICFVLAMVTYVFDIISDIVTGIFHYYDGRVIACVFILLLSIVPSVVLNAVSFAWICDDNHAKSKRRRQSPQNELKGDSQLLWRSMTIFSRFIVIVLSVSSYKFHVIPFLAFHFLISLAHIKALQPLETSSRALEEGLMWINAAIHTFTPFNMADGLTRWRYTAAYTVEAIEAMDGSVQFPYKIEAAVVAAVSFITGLSAMVIYYSCFHPNRRRHLRIPPPETENLHS
ncbi:hypothetical protein TELCIR_00298 [Teladorsagia circumcincta]|uniref:XK-related protein n=1 Tax=Teladorsagia circumcincta TaxID=45464 RepID=A0A2G9V510_TELCI|nr:hypothetical protein TELCIR_00298 [Teladorsagia circumcincta]